MNILLSEGEEDNKHVTTVIDPLTLLIKHKFAQDDHNERWALFEHGEYFIHANKTLSVYNKADYSNYIL